MEEREKSKPAVSVIIPVYNLENYLDTCLDSVGRQTYGDFEAIVVDDGSTDGSQAVARRHAERDARIVVVRTVNQGTARARETGIRHAQGDYICFLDGDDVWDSRMLEKLVAAIGENGGYDIVCCDYKRICKTYEAPRRDPDRLPAAARPVYRLRGLRVCAARRVGQPFAARYRLLR